MTKILFPYGREHLEYAFCEEELAEVLESSINQYQPAGAPEELIERAMREPVGSPRLCELAKGKKNVVIIASDHTRPVPSRLIIPPMLREIREASPEAEITILIATGCHRGTTKEELADKFGREIVETERILADFYKVLQPEQMKTEWTAYLSGKYYQGQTYEIMLTAIDDWGVYSNVVTYTYQP